jgi:hypothetical protein
MNNALFTTLTFAAMIAAAPLHAESLHFTATLDGASETPPTGSPGKGMADVTVDTDSKTISWTVTYSGLSGPATMGHFHGPAAVNVAAGVQIPMVGDISSPIKGSGAITDGQIGDLRGGLWYINIHTAKNPKGEIRGQLTQAK